MKKFILYSIFLGFANILLVDAQNYKYYLRAINDNFNPTFNTVNGVLDYIGSDQALDSLFSQNNIYIFEKAFPSARTSNFLRVFQMESDSNDLLNKFLSDTSHLFEYGENLGQELIELNYYPNDYGQTGGTNQGLNVNNSNLDFIQAPEAWQLSTGSSSVKIGISDGGVLDRDQEFVNKINVLDNSVQDQSHGTTVSAIAAAQGDNMHGITGVCYDCNLINTYWDWGDYNRLLDLHYAGAKIINMSWGSYNTYSPTRQAIIDTIYSNGTILVASSGNKKWTQSNNGTEYNYPASYNHVISVGSVGQRHETALDSIYLEPGNSSWRSENVKHHIAWRLQFNGDPNVNANVGYHSVLVNTNTFNDAVDILAPGVGIFMYGNYLVNNSWVYKGVFN